MPVTDGLLGTEEKDIIIPAIAKANEEGILAFGPYSSDGFFGSGAFSRFDAVLAMYHDQGMGAFKALAFDTGVNYHGRTAGYQDLAGARYGIRHNRQERSLGQFDAAGHIYCL